CALLSRFSLPTLDVAEEGPADDRKTAAATSCTGRCSRVTRGFPHLSPGLSRACSGQGWRPSASTSRVAAHPRSLRPPSVYTGARPRRNGIVGRVGAPRGGGGGGGWRRHERPAPGAR